jgi:hypothetical protein
VVAHRWLRVETVGIHSFTFPWRGCGGGALHRIRRRSTSPASIRPTEHLPRSSGTRFRHIRELMECAWIKQSGGACTQRRSQASTSRWRTRGAALGRTAGGAGSSVAVTGSLHCCSSAGDCSSTTSGVTTRNSDVGPEIPAATATSSFPARASAPRSSRRRRSDAWTSSLGSLKCSVEPLGVQGAEVFDGCPQTVRRYASMG